MLLTVLLASCTSADPNFGMDLTTAGYKATAPSAPSTSTTQPLGSGPTVPQPMMSAEGDTELPAMVAYLPVGNPATTLPPIPAPTAETPQAALEAEAAPSPASLGDRTGTIPAEAGASGDTLAKAAPENGALPASSAIVPPTRPAEAAASSIAEPDPSVASADASVAESDPSVAGTATTQEAVATAAPWPQANPPKKKTFLSAFFGATPASAATPRGETKTAKPLFQQQSKPVIATAAPAPKPIIATAAEPVIDMAEPARPVMMASLGNDDNSLPGVRQTALFEITRKSGLDDDSDVDLHEDEDSGVRMASAAGMARLAPNGLLKQTESVDVACLKPSLVRVLKTIESHYGRKIMVTSGYRDQSRNRRARGAKNSLHMYCAAADVQIAGVGKWELANYVRTMPGRGGVGTYCHTESVHVDVGPERDWNWRCRRRK